LHLELWILNALAFGSFTTSMIHIGNVTCVCTMCVSCHCIYGTIVTACKDVLLINWFEVCVIVNWFKICVCLQLTKIYACKKSLCFNAECIRISLEQQMKKTTFTFWKQNICILCEHDSIKCLRLFTMCRLLTQTPDIICQFTFY